MRQLYLSTYHLAPDLIPHYLNALQRYRVVYIAGYPSAVEAIAQEVLQLGRTDLRLAAVYANAEPVTAAQREVISAAFGCPTRESYGMVEGVAGASECPMGRLHQWPELGHVEVRRNGELVCTGLLNPDMILIRYRVGDRGQVPPDAEPCPCGRALPLMGPIEGRTDDVLITPDGRQAARMGAVFHGLPVRQSQIIQERADFLRVLVVPAAGFDDGHERTIAGRIRERLGEIEVAVERAPAIQRTSNGKLRAIVSRLTPAERAAVLGRDEEDAPAVRTEVG
jgi:phenylacetate-CoA ligase